MYTDIVFQYLRQVVLRIHHGQMNFFPMRIAIGISAVFLS